MNKFNKLNKAQKDIIYDIFFELTPNDYSLANFGISQRAKTKQETIRTIELNYKKAFNKWEIRLIERFIELEIINYLDWLMILE